MKVYLLAAGKGTRLRPITYTIPKCLVDISGKPLLLHWLDLLEDNDVGEVLINLSYLHNQVEKFLDEYNGSVIVHKTYEEVLLGSAGTIRKNIEFIENEQEFMIIYADNLTNLKLTDMITYHKDKKSRFTMGVFKTNRPKECGIVTMDDTGLINKFDEKPEHPETNMANAGIYIVDHSLKSIFYEESPFDIGKDVLPKLVGQMYGYHINSYFLDIGTKENYMKALREWTYG